MRNNRIILLSDEYELLEKLAQTSVTCSIDNAVDNPELDVADRLIIKGLCKITCSSPSKGFEYEITDLGKKLISLS